MKSFQELGEKERKRLLAKAVRLLSEWKPIPPELGKRLGASALRKLLEVVKMIRAQGLAGPNHRPPERLRAMKVLIARLMSDEAPSRDPAEMMPEPARSQQRGSESLLQRQSDAQESRTYKRELRNRRAGSSLL